jgi:hypothetical protein
MTTRDAYIDHSRSAKEYADKNVQTIRRKYVAFLRYAPDRDGWYMDELNWPNQ